MSNSSKKKLPTKIEFTGIIEIGNPRTLTSEFEVAMFLKKRLTLYNSKDNVSKTHVKIPQVVFLEVKEE